MRQGFADRPCRTVAAAAALACAIQAQEAPASRLGVRARASRLSEADVVHAIAVERTVVRTWLMRGTIHLVDTADLRWLARLIGPSLERMFHARWQQLGLTREVRDAILGALPSILADGPLVRREIRRGLNEAGIMLDTSDPQAYSHALFYASAVGLVCRGPDVGRDATFTLLDEWVPDAPAGPSGDDALAELARRYFAAFSPATTHDFGTWSRLAAGRAVNLIRDELTPVDVDGRNGWRLGPAVPPARGLRLLPAYDNYLVGYKHRDAILAGTCGRGCTWAG